MPIATPPVQMMTASVTWNPVARRISEMTSATNQSHDITRNTLRKSTCTGFGAGLQASGLMIGANFMLLTIVSSIPWAGSTLRRDVFVRVREVGLVRLGAVLALRFGALALLCMVTFIVRPCVA